ncbi:two-component system sensor histidine kinase CreC [Leptospira idonii]|uniref:histidine kinase n=1 Tax=Leptospira idonii TaxID=1193500 RepID=A0A4R9M077_9LEPT|nr:two-component system sensor histidine kinase CreC [Leptospira idonii]TGN19321.1 two-component system sensor histidine kinase CreC [Leptospira idonii]
MDSNCHRFFFVLGIGFYYLIDRTEDSIRPRYMETVEESVNDTAHLFASLVEDKISSLRNISEPNLLETQVFQILNPVFEKTKDRSLQAKIYSQTKTRVDLQIYVTDAKGIVIYDSEGYRKGLDYSRYNDVLLTLQGKYGARSSKLLDPEKEGAIFVAAPVFYKGKISAVLTVVKPKIALLPFIELAKEKFWQISIFVAVVISLVFTILAYLVFHPIRRLSRYVSELRSGNRPSFPKIGIKEIGELGREMDGLIRELEGKEYIENYIQTLTHEIKSPLSSILASAELLESNPERKQTLIGNIQTEGKRIQSIIEKLLDLSSLEGTWELEMEANINLFALADEIKSSFSDLSEKKNIRLEILGEPLFVKANRFFLTLALRNLIQNALEFSPSGSTVQIQTKEEEGVPVCTVLDEGEGIPGYALSKIFDRFYSLPRPDSGKKSSGLGLSFVKQVAVLHGAEIRVENRAGKGVSARFIFLGQLKL